MENPIQTEPKKSNTGMMIGIGVVVVFVLMCCCAVAVIGALTLMGPVVGRTFSSINDMPEMPDFPTISPDMTMPSIKDIPTISPDATLPSISDVVPSGGKGDELQRAQAWTQILVTAATDGCSFSLKATEATIVVTQEPDSKGVWAEDWTVKCDGGTQKTYNVTFTPGSNNDTTIKIK